MQAEELRVCPQERVRVGIPKICLGRPYAILVKESLGRMRPEITKNRRSSRESGLKLRCQLWETGALDEICPVRLQNHSTSSEGCTTIVGNLEMAVAGSSNRDIFLFYGHTGSRSVSLAAHPEVNGEAKKHRMKPIVCMDLRKRIAPLRLDETWNATLPE
jgi:hypothetical protein